IVTGDSWYSGVENLKFLRNQKLGFLFGIEKNRTVSNEPGKYCPVRSLEKMRSENIISNWYEVQRNLFTLVVRDYIVDNLTNACAASST
ncbi:hypothetical protein IQ226_23470, partial [Dolichospermum sp. LEGE 00240]|nr:hypothetical protein [Dolichospermum sp. LEGE 00240]